MLNNPPETNITLRYRISNLIEVVLEGKNTVIYIAGERFQICKYLLLAVPEAVMWGEKEIESIDEAAELLDPSREGFFENMYDPVIPPHVEFWGHCSNLQAWVEHAYDTRLLHRSIAFPLLKSLADLGDERAKNKFIKEIYDRAKSGHPAVINYLAEEGYLSKLPVPLLESLHLPPHVRVGRRMYFMQKQALRFEPETFHSLDQVQGLRSLPDLETLDLTEQSLQILPDWIGDLTTLRSLTIDRNGLIALPPSIGNLRALECLYVNCNGLETLPTTMGNLESIQVMNFAVNELIRLPDSMGSLSNLIKLGLAENHLSAIPHTVGGLSSLKLLILGKNAFTTLPDSFAKLENLEELDLSENRFNKIPACVGSLSSLKRVKISENPLLVPPLELEALPSLVEVYGFDIALSTSNPWKKWAARLEARGCKVYLDRNPDPAYFI